MLSSSSPGFIRPSRGVTSTSNFHFFFVMPSSIHSLNEQLSYTPCHTGFGSALNIETLVAAAEKRETPIEVLECMTFSISYKIGSYFFVVDN